MIKKTKKTIDQTFVFESSWEVCNRVGGIYTVLSTHAKEMKRLYGDGLCFIGPDIPVVYAKDGELLPNELFSEESTPLDAWRDRVLAEGKLRLRTGRWNVPGRPLVILVDFRPYYAMKAKIYADLWDWFGVDSLHAYGDYDEAAMFAYACGEVIGRFCESQCESAALSSNPSSVLPVAPKIVAHFHEWTTGIGLLYCKHFLPQVATVFTTHATSIGRSICGNNKPLYDYMLGYHGDQMAQELNMQSKHSVEKIAAHQADGFTTVSEITAKECAQLLEKKPDVVTPNGFEDDFLLPADSAKKMRIKARKALMDVAEAMFGYSLPEDTLLLATAGRYEYHNKGLDAFIDSLHRLQQDDRLNRTVLAYILVPGNVSAPRQELMERLKSPTATELGPIYHPFNTHWLYSIENDSVLNAVKRLGFGNSREEKVKIVFVPCYLHGNDGIFNMNYYELLQGFDLTAFLSYYEPWGYTPLESIAFSIPTLTTTLSGFGAWYLEMGAKSSVNAAPQTDAENDSVCLLNDLSGGVAVIDRRDGNYDDVVKQAAEIVLQYSLQSSEACRNIARQAQKVSKQALWKHFIKYYQQTYRLALKKKEL